MTLSSEPRGAQPSISRTGSGAELELPAGVELVAELGRGAHGVVYRVRREGHDWAMKVFASQLDTNGVTLTALRREAALLAWVGHPGLPRVHEVGQAGNRPYLIMDLVEGASLSTVLASGPAAIERIVDLGTQIAGTLAAVHEVGLVHRDVKPGNIMIEPGGRVRLIDFGAAAQAGGEHADMVVGTLLYCAPEQSGTIKRPVDARSDLYALGVVLFEAVAGRPPFVTDDVGELLRMHTATEPPRLDALRSEVPAALADVVARLLAKDPDDRYQSAAALVTDLLALRNDRLGEASPTDGHGEASPTDVLDAADPAGLAPLIGRDAERARLVDRWRQAGEGRGGVALVSGGPGSGTTRLAQEVATVVRRQGLPVLWASCDGGAGPLSALRTAIDLHLYRIRRLPAPARDAAIGAIRDAAGEAAPLLARLSPVLANVLTRGAPEIGVVVDPDALTRAAAAFLAELARVTGGVLLCLDDAPQADEASQTVLRMLVNDLADTPLLVLLTAHNCTRSPDTRLPETVTAAADCVVALNALDDLSVRSMVVAVARGLAVDAEVTDRLIAGCGVSPFEIQEYVRAVVDAGLLVPHWGTVRLDVNGLDALALPQDVFELILRRVDGLGSRCRDLLTAGAAIGLRFDGELVARASDLAAAEASDLLDQAVARMVVEHHDGALRFVHDGIRRALLDGLDEPARRRLHQRIADILHETSSADPAHIYALGRHCLLGTPQQAPARAFAALFAAGQQALGDCAPAEAVKLLERASELAEQVASVDRSEVDELLGQAHHRAGAFTAALRTLDRALAAHSDPVDQARVLLHIHEVYLGAGDVDAARATILRAMAGLGQRLPSNPFILIASSLVRFGVGRIIERLGRQTTDPAQHARYEAEALLLSNLAVNRVFMLAPLDAVWLSMRSLYPASRLRPCEAYVRTWAALGAIARGIGLPSGRAYRRAENAAKTMGDPALHAGVLWLERVLGLNKSADLRPLMTEIPDRTGMIPSNIYLSVAVHGAWQLLGAGYARAAQTLRDQAVARLATVDQAEHELTLCGIATASALGRITEAGAMLRTLEDQPDEHQNPDRQLVTLLARATAAFEQQDLGATFDQIVDELTAMRVNIRLLMPSHLTIYPIIAYGRIEQCRRAAPQQRAATLQAAEAAVDELGRASGPVAKAHHCVATAFLQHLRGEHRAALATVAGADHLLGDVHAPSISFEGARLQARALTALGRLTDATAAAAAALTLAEMHEWPHRAQWIRTEFPDLRSPGSGISGTTEHFRHTTSHTTHRQLLAALEQMTNAASGILDPDQLTRVALDEIIRLLSAERAFLFLADEDDHLVPHLGRDTAGNDLIELTDYGSTLVERVRLTREPLVVAGTDEGVALGSQSVVVHGLRSIMVAPLQFDERLLGVVYLDSRVAKGMFTASDIGVLAALMTHVGAALETARAAQLAVSAESVKRERDLAETLRVAMADLSATLDPTDVLRRLHATAARVFVADRSWLAIMDADKIEIFAGTEHEAPSEPPMLADPDPALHRLLALDEPLLGGPATPPPAVFDVRGQGWMAIPLRLANTPVGVIVLGTDHPSGYGAAQADIAGVLANHGMTAYHNARLFSQTEQLATTDPLTGLANRRHFFTGALHRIALAQRQRSPLVAAMIDIDHFKQVNDVHGHHVGDQVIKTVAQRLAHTARRTDVVGRYGGEEFALILPDTGIDGAFTLVERLRATVAEQPIDTDAGPLTVTVSVGVAQLGADQTDVEILLADADAALYRAKRAGRNRVVVADETSP